MVQQPSKTGIQSQTELYHNISTHAALQEEKSSVVHGMAWRTCGLRAAFAYTSWPPHRHALHPPPLHPQHIGANIHSRSACASYPCPAFSACASLPSARMYPTLPLLPFVTCVLYQLWLKAQTQTLIYPCPAFNQTPQHQQSQAATPHTLGPGAPLLPSPPLASPPEHAHTHGAVSSHAEIENRLARSQFRTDVHAEGVARLHGGKGHRAGYKGVRSVVRNGAVHGWARWEAWCFVQLGIHAWFQYPRHA